MGKVLINGGGGGAGGLSDDMSAANGVTADLVPKGQTYIGADTDDEIGTGTMELEANANAQTAHVLNGEKFFTKNEQLPDKPLTGTMPNIGALDTTTKARLNGNNLVLGMTNGAHITNGGSGTLGTPEVQISFTEMANNTTISGQLNAANIKKGATVFGKTGTFTGVGNAAQANVLAGKTFSNNTQMGVAGTMPNVGATEQRKSYALSGTNLVLRMTNGAHITNASSGYPEVYIPQSEVASAYGVTANKIAFGQTVMGITGTNAGGAVVQSDSPFVNGTFPSGSSISNFGASSWLNPHYGTTGSNSVAVENQDHIRVTFTDYERDKSLSGNSGYVLTYNRLLSFSNIRTITVKFMGVQNSRDGFGYSNTFSVSSSSMYFQIGTTNGGSNIATGRTSVNPSSYSISGTVISDTVKTGTMVTLTWDVSNITVNGYLSIHFGGTTYNGSSSSDSFQYVYMPFFNVYSIAFS